MKKKPIYHSDGIDYKLIAHGVSPFDLGRVNKTLIDPRRKTWAYGFWTEGAEDW